jgi:hypothetical protein
MIRSKGTSGRHAAPLGSDFNPPDRPLAKGLRGSEAAA